MSTTLNQIFFVKSRVLSPHIISNYIVFLYMVKFKEFYFLENIPRIIFLSILILFYK